MYNLSKSKFYKFLNVGQKEMTMTDTTTPDTATNTPPTHRYARVLSIASDDTVDRVNTLNDLTVPVITDLDKKVLEAAEAGNLDMCHWHCGTTHCRAGWAVVFGGEDGKTLESKLGSELAGRLIYEASTGRIAPDFFASNSAAMDDIRRCAAP